jgi:transposase
LRDQRPPCPDCHNEDVKIKGYELKRINYGVLADRKLILIYRARRYICPVCRRTFYEPNPFCFKAMKISAMTVKNVLRDLKSVMPQKEIGADYKTTANRKRK